MLDTKLPIAYLHRYTQTCSRSRRSLVQSLLSARDTAAEPAYWPHWWMYKNSEKQVKKRKNLCLAHCIICVFSLWLLVCNLVKTMSSFFTYNKKKLHILFQYFNPNISASYSGTVKQNLSCQTQGIDFWVLPRKKLRKHNNCYCCWQMLGRGKYNMKQRNKKAPQPAT